MADNSTAQPPKAIIRDENRLCDGRSTESSNAACRQSIDLGLSWPAAIECLSGRSMGFQTLARSGGIYAAFVRQRRRNMIQLLAAAATKPD